jgi:predicted ATPase/DNA-binding winged helix-turn-helix (wHTH) protein
VAPPYRFGPFELQPDRRRLVRDGQALAVGSRAFDVLLALVERPGRLVTKSELLDRVWPELEVQEANLPVQVSALRKLLGADFIATIPGLGYRFAASLQELAEPVPPKAPPVEARTNIPAPRDPLFARDDMVQALSQQLGVQRLITLVGPGGIGKSRIAQAVGLVQAQQQAGGTWWVDLAAHVTEASIVPAIAQAAQLPLGPGDDPLIQLCRLVASREMLLVLDNCEHLGSPLAHAIGRLLDAAPRLRVLATSQRPLHLRGEQLCPVPTLADEGALQLLLHRAHAVAPRFELPPSALAEAAALCRELDGLPLAIEMAAARLPMLGLASLRSRLAARLTLLRADGSDGPARHATLRALLDWSCALLNTAEQSVLRRLAVFGGSFPLELALRAAAFEPLDAEQVLQGMEALVERSLIHVDQTDPPRYRLLETTRLHALEHLREAGEEAAALEAHGHAMAWRARELLEQNRTEDDWLHQTPDYDNMSLAFERAVERADAETAAHVVRCLRMLDQLRGQYAQQRQRVRAAQALAGQASPRARAHLLRFIASCGWIGEGPLSRLQAARASAALWRQLEDAAGLHDMLPVLATEAARTGAFDEAHAALHEAQALERRTWPLNRRAARTVHQAWVALCEGDSARCRAAWQEAHGLLLLAGWPRTAALAQDGLAAASLMEGAVDHGVQISRDLVAALEDMGHSDYLARALHTLCQGLILQDCTEEAVAAGARALLLLEPLDLACALADEAAVLLARRSLPQEAAWLLGVADAWHEAEQSPRDALSRRMATLAESLVHDSLGSTAASAARQTGATLDAEAALCLLRSAFPRHVDADAP